MRQESFARQDNGMHELEPPDVELRGQMRPLGSLLVELLRELKDLFLTEVELTRTEVSQKIEQAATGLGALVIGASVAVAGMMTLVAAAVIAVNDYLLHNWALSALIVGVAVLMVGVGCVMAGKNRIEAPKLLPERAARNVREDARFLKEEIERRV
jgi:hypothetical protein